MINLSGNTQSAHLFASPVHRATVHLTLHLPQCVDIFEDIFVVRGSLCDSKHLVFSAVYGFQCAKSMICAIGHPCRYRLYSSWEGDLLLYTVIPVLWFLHLHSTGKSAGPQSRGHFILSNSKCILHCSFPFGFVLSSMTLCHFLGRKRFTETTKNLYPGSCRLSMRKKRGHAYYSTASPKAFSLIINRLFFY